MRRSKLPLCVKCTCGCCRLRCCRYVLAYIDRINVSFAALTMRDDLHMSAGDFGFAVGTFYWAYFLFEVPSNVITGEGRRAASGSPAS